MSHYVTDGAAVGEETAHSVGQPTDKSVNLPIGYVVHPVHARLEVTVDTLVFIGRILFVSLLFASAYGHLSATEQMAEYTKSKGVPFPRQMTLISGLVLLIAGLSILFGVWADLGALLLFVFLIPTAVLMHAFWKERDAGARQVEMINFMKDVALAGASLMLFALFAYAGSDLGLMISRPAVSLG
jgi:putative oxidoreductase